MGDLHAWDNFYVILGSAAGALIGLQFVVMTLIAEKPRPGSGDAASAFGTPTVVHLSCCLLISALVNVPWPDMSTGSITGGLVGLAGFAYMIVTVRRMHQQDVYELDWEDRIFHVILPFVAYALLVVSSLASIDHAYQALFGVGVTTLLLLFIGIHNAWDAVAYQVFVIRRRDAGSE